MGSPTALHEIEMRKCETNKRAQYLTLSVDNGTDSSLVAGLSDCLGRLTELHIGYLGNAVAPDSGVEDAVGEPLGGRDLLIITVAGKLTIRILDVIDLTVPDSNENGDADRISPGG